MAATIRTRKRGKTYSYSFDIGKDPATGKRKMKEKGGFESEQAAFDAGAEAYSDWKHGNIGIISEKIMLKDYLKTWLENVARPAVKRKTYSNYIHGINRINKYIGSINLQDLSALHIDAWLNNMVKDGYAKKTISTTKSILSSALSYAIHPGNLIKYNPTFGMKVPNNSVKSVVKRYIVDDDWLDKFTAKYGCGHKYHLPIVIEYKTGMRISEVLGLEWEQVDLDTGKISVIQQQERDIEGKTYYFDTPKNDASVRDFYMDKELIEELKIWKAYQSRNELRMGKGYQIVYEDENRNMVQLPKCAEVPEGYIRKNLVCTRKNGRAILYPTIRNFLSNLNGMNSHSFRHTHATQLIEGGARDIDIAGRLGHADASMVQKCYGHDTEKMMLGTVSIIEKQVVDKKKRRQNVDKKENKPSETVIYL